MKIHILSFTHKDDEFYKAIRSNIEFLIQNSKYTITDDKFDCDIYLILFQGVGGLNYKLLTEYEPYTKDIENLETYDWIHGYGDFYEHLKLFMKNNPNKKFIGYFRSDQSGMDESHKNLLDVDNYKLTIRDYLSLYFDNEEFLVSNIKLLVPEIEKYFNWTNTSDKYSNPTITKRLDTNKKLSDKYRNKLFLFTLRFYQYGPFLLDTADGNDIRKIKKLTLKKYHNIPIDKKFDIFYCKHQRNTVDGISRRYILDIVMPRLQKKYNVATFESTNVYQEYLQSSKIVISPFGLGERVEDDDLALYYDTIVIKPYSKYDIYDYFNTFTSKSFNEYHKQHFTPCIVFCKDDYSDIEAVIENVKNNYGQHLENIKKRKEELYMFVNNNNLQEDFINRLDTI